MPEPGRRVLAKRRSGDVVIARLDRKQNALYRDPSKLEWLNDDDKFVSLTHDPVESWEPFE